MAVTTWTAGQVLTAADLNDTLASKPAYSYGTATPSAPSTGDIWYDSNETPAQAKFYDGSSWQVFSSGVGDADFSNTATGTYTDGGGQSWKYITFTSSGTLTVTTEGWADILVVGGGGGGVQGGTNAGGGGGGVRYGNFILTAGSYTVTVGAGGSGATETGSNNFGSDGSTSSLGSVLSAGGGGGGATIAGRKDGVGGGGSGGGVSAIYTANHSSGGGAGGSGTTGLSLDYTGSSVTYGAGGSSSGLGGNGSATRNANAGTVIVRVRT